MPMVKGSAPCSQLPVSFAELPPAGVSSGSREENGESKTANDRALIARRQFRVQPAAFTQRDASRIASNGDSTGMTEETRRSTHSAGIGMTEATRRSTHGGQSTNAKTDASERGTSKEGTRDGSVAHSLHDPPQSPPQQQDKAHAHCPAASTITSSSGTAKKQIHGLSNLELCAGSAGYSAKLFKHGLSTLPIDAPHNKHKQKLPCVTLDLCLPSSQELLMKLLADKRIFSLGAAPPCGTATRAREKKMKHIPASQQPKPPP